MTSSTESSASGVPNPTEVERLRRENEQLAVEVRVLELKVQKLQRQTLGQEVGADAVFAKSSWRLHPT